MSVVVVPVQPGTTHFGDEWFLHIDQILRDAGIDTILIEPPKNSIAISNNQYQYQLSTSFRGLVESRHVKDGDVILCLDAVNADVISLHQIIEESGLSLKMVGIWINEGADSRLPDISKNHGISENAVSNLQQTIVWYQLKIQINLFDRNIFHDHMQVKERKSHSEFNDPAHVTQSGLTYSGNPLSDRTINKLDQICVLSNSDFKFSDRELDFLNPIKIIDLNNQDNWSEDIRSSKALFILSNKYQFDWYMWEAVSNQTLVFAKNTDRYIEKLRDCWLFNFNQGDEDKISLISLMQGVVRSYNILLPHLDTKFLKQTYFESNRLIKIIKDLSNV